MISDIDNTQSAIEYKPELAQNMLQYNSDANKTTNHTVVIPLTPNLTKTDIIMDEDELSAFMSVEFPDYNDQARPNLDAIKYDNSNATVKPNVATSAIKYWDVRQTYIEMKRLNIEEKSLQLEEKIGKTWQSRTNI